MCVKVTDTLKCPGKGINCGFKQAVGLYARQHENTVTPERPKVGKKRSYGYVYKGSFWKSIEIRGIHPQGTSTGAEHTPTQMHAHGFPTEIQTAY